MGTHSRIGYRDPDTKKIHSIYCHWDGYLSNNGKILKEHYTDLNKIKELVALGDISNLEANVTPSPGVKHTFDEPAKDVVTAYHRDRGEPFDGVRAMIHDTDMRSLEEYNYLFDTDSKWYWKDEDSASWKLVP